MYNEVALASLEQKPVAGFNRNMIDSTYQFERELPAATSAEIARLQMDGYIVHKEWTNGIELRKGKPFRSWLLALQVIFPFWLFPGVMRSVVDNLFGYKHRVLVTRDQNDSKVILV